jgi:hypothetical protein
MDWVCVSYLDEVDAELVVPLVPEAGGVVTPDAVARPEFAEGSGINEHA